MKFIPENFKVEILDQIFIETGSEPKDLLNWLQGVLKDHPYEQYPCNNRKYLGEYSFYSYPSDSPSQLAIELKDPYEVKNWSKKWCWMRESNDSDFVTVFNFYLFLLEDQQFRAGFFKWYREYFKLEE